MTKKRQITQTESGATEGASLALRLEVLLEKNRTAIDELSGVVAEAHGVLRDLRQEIKKAETIGPALVTKRLRAEVERAVSQLDSETDKAIRHATEKSTRQINKRFDELMKIMLGEEDDGKPSVLDMLDRLGPLLPILTKIAQGDERIGQVQTVKGLSEHLNSQVLKKLER